MGSAINFTVIIPTRERADTLLHCLRTVVMQDYADLTILVSDNFSQDNTKQVVDSFHDPRIKHINTGKRISMSHNYEFAINHVKEGWVTLIGDDDGLLPGALTTIAEVIRKTGCQAVVSDRCCYTWPGGSVADDKDTLTVPLNKGFEWRSTRTWMSKLMRGDSDHHLPYLYTGGFVDSRIINKARSSEGIFYFSKNPDSYSVFALASVLDKYVMLKEPVAIGGWSYHSVGSSLFGATNNQEPAKKFLYEERNIPLHDRLMQYKDWFKSNQINIYESYLQSAHIHHDFLKIKMEDQLGLALSMISSKEYGSLRKICVEIAAQNGIDMSVVDGKEKEYRRWEFFKSWKRRIYRSFNYRVLSGKEFGIQDIYGASILAKAVYLQETRYAGWRLKKCLQAVIKLLGRLFRWK